MIIVKGWSSVFRICVVFGIVSGFNVAVPQPSAAVASGSLVAIGGGAISASLRTRIVELAGGWECRVLVIPFASQRPEGGPGTVRVFEELGASNVGVLDLDADPIAQIEAADLIWLGGGSQSRLLETLSDPVEDALRKKLASGGVIAGTSAGAAVMSTRMITGNAELEMVTAATTELVAGLGFWPGIIDQHFHKRRRFNRLLAAVLDHPDSVGVGIDESTAAVFQGKQLTVWGESSVLVVDARQARVERARGGTSHQGVGVQLHLLRPGTTFRIDTGETSTPPRERF